MNPNFIKETFLFIAGKPAEQLADLLNDKTYINEFLIAKKMNINVNQIRNILYKISEHGLVSFVRKKDKRKGWYTYSWKIEKLKTFEFLKEVLNNKINQLNFQLNSRKTKVFYFCENCNIEFNEEKSLLNDFTCNECGNVLSLKDTSEDISSYNKEINRINNQIKLLEEEIQLEKQKLEKQKIKEAKKIKEIKENKKIKDKKNKINEKNKKISLGKPKKRKSLINQHLKKLLKNSKT